MRSSYVYRGLVARNSLAKYKHTLLTTQLKVGELQEQLECVLRRIEECIANQNAEQEQISRKDKTFSQPNEYIQMSTDDTVSSDNNTCGASILIPAVKCS